MSHTNLHCRRRDRTCARSLAALAIASAPLLVAPPATAAGPAGHLLGFAESSAADLRVEPPTLSFTATAPPKIYVEIDWMEDETHSHRPSQAVLDEVRATFAAAGYDIHLELSDAIPHEAVVDLTGSPSKSAAITALREAYSNHLDDDRWHYSLWAHNYSWYGTPTSSSGYGDLPGRVHLVTLGSFANQTGTFSNQVGTFVHELGHNLGQRHGGADNGNYKPNYLSIMNYLYQLDGIGPGLLGRGFAATASGFDDFGYSHGLLPELDEANLDETRGLGLGKAVDWNCDGVLESGVGKDVQARSHCSASGGLGRLADFDNWTNVTGFLRTADAGGAGSGPGEEGAPCTTWEVYRPQFERLERLRARGLLPPDGPRPRVRRAGAWSRGAATFVLHNDGDASLVVTGLALDTPTAWIRWEPQAPFTVAAGGSQNVHVLVALDQVPEGITTRRLLVYSTNSEGASHVGGVDLAVGAGGEPAPEEPLPGFYTLTPCRLLDTRGGVALAADTDYAIAVTGACGIPATAKAVAFNVTAIGAGAGGSLGVWPAGQTYLGTSAVAFAGAGARAANGVYGLALDGSGTLAARSSAPLHLVLDVFGYFQ
jgi:hypothetical protein